MSQPKCIFCKIISGEKKEEIIYQDKDMAVLADIHPRTPTHLLITPRQHYEDFAEMMLQEPELLLRIGEVVEKLVDELGLRGEWYTWGFHGGGKQSVNHIHAQLLAGMKEGELVL